MRARTIEVASGTEGEKRKKGRRERGREGEREGGREGEREGEGGREGGREGGGREREWGKYKCISTKIKMSPSVITDHYKSNC